METRNEKNCRRNPRRLPPGAWGVLCLLFARSLAAAPAPGPDCGTLFAETEGQTGRWEDLPSALRPHWSSEAAAAVLEHPRARDLKQKYNDGTGLVLAVEHGDSANVTGWSIQAGLLRDVLALLFPKAKFVKFSEAVGKEGVTRFSLSDQILNTGQIAGTLSLRSVDMTLLKMLNPGPKPISRGALRRQMKLPPSARVGSVYIGKNLKESAAIDAVKDLFKKGSADIVVLSDQGGYATSEAAAAMRRGLRGQNVRVLNSSDLAKDSVALEEGKKYLIVNETRGRLPYVHAAADFSLILAEGNLFESITAGVPTYFLNRKQLAPVSENGGAVAEGWERVAKFAQAAGAKTVMTANLSATSKGARKPPAGLAAGSVEVLPGITAAEALLGQIGNSMEFHRPLP